MNKSAPPAAPAPSTNAAVQPNIPTFSTDERYPKALIENTTHGDDWKDSGGVYPRARVADKYDVVPASGEVPTVDALARRFPNRVWEIYAETAANREAYASVAVPRCSEPVSEPLPAVPDVDLISRPHLYGSFTFFSSAKYPKARICDTSAIVARQEVMLWLHYEKNNTFKGAEVYIKPNASGGVFFPAASAHEVGAQDTRLPSSFMSAKEYPRAVIDHDKAGDDHLTRYWYKHGTFVGAPVYI